MNLIEPLHFIPKKVFNFINYAKYVENSIGKYAYI